MTGRRGISVLLLVAVTTVVGCTGSHRPPAGDQRPAPTIELVKAQGGLACPAHAPDGEQGTPLVPSSPAAGAGRLAPSEPPTQMVICRYRGTTDFRLVGSRRVRSGLAQAATELTWMPRANAALDNCTAIGGRHTPYLVGLKYPDGELWLSTAYDVNGCVRTSNGRFTAEPYIGDDADHAYGSGVWVAGFGLSAATPSCGNAPRGRLGQDQQLVPPGAVRLTLCVTNGAPSAPSAPVLVRRDFSELLHALNTAATTPTSNSCDPHGENLVGYDARFDYAEGPAVVVSIRKNCYPLLSNGSLDGVGSARIWALTDGLARQPG